MRARFPQELSPLSSLGEWSSLAPSERLVLATRLEPRLAARGVVLSRRTVGAHDLLAFDHPPTGHTFVCIPGGRMRMGVSDAELDEMRSLVGPGDASDVAAEIALRARPAHEVSVPPFLLARAPLLGSSSRGWTERLDPDAERPYFGEGDVPLHLTAAETAAVLEELGNGFRLPTEAEWEHVGREGGSTSWLAGGPNAERQKIEASVEALYLDSSYRPDRADGRNAFGCWGLVFGEWVRDGWHPSYDGAPRDGSAWEPRRVPEITRGGGAATFPWRSGPEILGCHAGFREAADGTRFTAGVRLVLDL
jgi:formylglycine-generating enzyme required for sulfatase activity